jgi:hypothetical protein
VSLLTLLLAAALAVASTITAAAVGAVTSKAVEATWTTAISFGSRIIVRPTTHATPPRELST